MAVVAAVGLTNVFCGGGGGGGDSGGTSATTGTTDTATFTGTQGGANPAAQDLTARNLSTSEQAWSATASSKDAGRVVPAWLTIATSSGTVAAGGTITLTVSVNLAGLAPGTYTATITLSPASVFDPPSFTITLTVSAATGGGTEPTPDTTIDAAEKDAPDQGLEGANSLVVHIMSVWGGSRSDSTFQAGDFIKVRYILKTYGTNGTDGTNLTLADVKYGEIVVSGPTSHYQPVFAKTTDVLTVSQLHSSNDGSYVYTFANPIPATYAAPIDDSPSFGPADGEWQGQALVAGTYTAGMMFYREVSITEPNGTAATYRVGDTHVRDFLFGGASTFESREVVTRQNCNQCHGVIRMHKKLSHGRGTRRDTRYCVLCHVDGSEDGNDPTVAGGTPGVSISFRNMIHKVHMGHELPSVEAGGTYQIADGTTLDDFSELHYPVMPDHVMHCLKCHGDPDGSGPLAAPTQGGQYATMPSRMVCGACHDTVNFATGAGHEGGVQTTDTDCAVCHKPGGLVDQPNVHTHPLRDPVQNPGVNVNITGVTNQVGATALQVGDKIAATFTLKDDAGNNVNIADVESWTCAVSGPTTSFQTVVAPIGFTSANVTGTNPYTLQLPMIVWFERLGTATGGADTFTAQYSPFRTGSFYETRDPLSTASMTVLERTATAGGSTTLNGAVTAWTNRITVADVTGFARNDYVVIDDGVAGEEYVKVLRVEGSYIWFGPHTRNAHADGVFVREVTLTAKTVTTHYTTNNTAGQVTTVAGQFTGGNVVLITYITDARIPAVYRNPRNDSPDLAQAAGEWMGLAVQPGTYSLWIRGTKSVQVAFSGTVGGANPTNQTRLSRNNSGADQAVSFSKSATWLTVTPNAGTITNGSQLTVTFAANTAGMTAGIYRDTVTLSPASGFSVNTWKVYLTLNNTGQTTFALGGGLGTIRAASPAAFSLFLLGSATTIVPRQIIADGAACDKCHDRLAMHGASYRGLDTCLHCHGVSGFEDSPQYGSTTTFTNTTPGATPQLLNMIHKIHRGEELFEAATYTIVGGAGTNYTFGEIMFPRMPAGVRDCRACHGTSDAWQQPTTRNHPAQTDPTRHWEMVCFSCHDDPAVAASMVGFSPSNNEGCAVCHKPGSAIPAVDVSRVHVNR